MKEAGREQAGPGSPQFQRENCGIWCFLVATRKGEDLTEQALGFARSRENRLEEAEPWPILFHVYDPFGQSACPEGCLTSSICEGSYIASSVLLLVAVLWGHYPAPHWAGGGALEQRAGFYYLPISCKFES